jgi:uncharacterized protein (DUF305 family)
MVAARRFAGTLLLCLLLAACSREATAPAPEPPASGAGQSVLPPAFGLTERAFVELAIATDDQAVKLLDLGARAARPALRELATEIGAARRAEITRLRGLLATAAVEYVNNHEGHDMPGMPTDEEITALDGSGAGFDAMFVKLVRAHLDESGVVVRSAAQAVSDEPTRAVAQLMETDRIDFLKRLGQAGVAG